MEIIKNFGVDPVLLAAQIFNFLIVFFVLKKFLYKPILDLLQKRQGAIREGIKQAEEAKIKLEKVVIEERNILRNAQLQAKKIIEEAKTESIELTKRMNDSAKKQGEKMLNDAKDQILRESKDAEKRLAVNISKLAVSFLEKSLNGFFTPKEQKEVVSNALMKILEKGPLSSGQN